MKQRLLSSILLAGLVSLASCSSKSSGSPAPGSRIDIPGVWKVWTQVPNEVEVGPAALYLSLTGTTIVGADLSGTVNGNTFEFTASVFNGSSTAKGTLTSPTTASGTYTTKVAGAADIVGAFRMEKFSPTGSVSVKGSILGTDLTHQSNTAVGIRKYLDDAHTILVETEVVTGSPMLNFELDLDPRNLAVGVLPVGVDPKEVGAAIEFSTGAVSARAQAIGGTLVVTKFDMNGFTATFNLNLISGDTITGSIEIDFNLHALHPFGI